MSLQDDYCDLRDMLGSKHWFLDTDWQDKLERIWEAFCEMENESNNHAKLENKGVNGENKRRHADKKRA